MSLITPLSTVVIKIGGSLLALPDLGERLNAVLQSLNGQKALVIIGGGAAADEIRRLDDFCELTPKRAHWDAIAAMTSNSQLIARVLGSLPVVPDRIEAALHWKTYAAVMLDTSVFLREKHATFSQLLPESWDVTSDSIAGSVALDWPCDQVLFCKSCNPVSLVIDEVCIAGQFDAWITSLRPALQDAQVPLRWLNLQTDGSQIQPLRWSA